MRRASFKSMILIALSLLWGSAALNAAQKEFESKCIKVYDGDSITLQCKQAHKTLKIRLYGIDAGIDAPELKQNLGKKSRDKLRELVLHKTLIVRVRGKDRYQRHIGEVFEGNMLINTYMLSKGLALRWCPFSDTQLAKLR